MQVPHLQSPFRYFRYNKDKLGAKPGTIFIPHDAQPTRIYEYHYDATGLHEFPPADVATVAARPLHPKGKTRWLDVRGLKDQALFDWLESTFGVHPLELEDLASMQNPKVEQQHGHLFMISRMVYYNAHKQLVNDQLSFFVFNDTLITIQETYEDVLEPVRARMRNENMPLRKRQSEYLAYALLDAVVDHYYLVLNDLGEKMENLEQALIRKPRRQHRDQIMRLKHDLLGMRRIVWPSRELVNNLIRHEYLCGQEDIGIYLRDVYDHLVNLLDLTENYRELSSSLLDLYNTQVSNNMNEIMKVLTMISAIFIPLSFIAGVYGMNFSPTNKQGLPLPLNMPELYQPNGYVWAVAIMLGIAVLQLLLFWYKGWFKRW